MPLIRFHLDESVKQAVALAAMLRGEGIDVTMPLDVGLIGASDPEQLAFSAGEQRVLITHDSDFLRLHEQGAVHAGICYTHQQKHSVGTLGRMLILLHHVYNASEMNQRVEFL